VDGIVKDSVLYMGLFLMAFVLYANERNRPAEARPSDTDTEAAAKVADSTPAVNRPVIESVPSDLPAHGADAKIQALFQIFLSDAMFSRPADGLRLVREPRAIEIQLYGDDVFTEGEIAVRESWYPVIDRIAEKLTADEFKKGLKVEIRGFADEASQREVRSSDFGHSDFTFSFARAEWLARYLERKWGISLQDVFTLKGMGSRPYGKKVEVWLSY
jgi:flagellar motor protein MotB